MTSFIRRYELDLIGQLENDARKRAISKEHTELEYIDFAEAYKKGRIDEEHLVKYQNSLSSCHPNDVRMAMLSKFSKSYHENIYPLYGDNFQATHEHFMKTANLFGMNTAALNDAANVSDVYRIWQDMLWDAVEEKLQNPSLLRFIKQSEIISSDLFWTFMITYPYGPARDISYGCGYDLAGKFIVMRKDDPMRYWLPLLTIDTGDDYFKHQVFVNEQVIKQIKTSQRILILNAGLMPELIRSFFATENPFGLDGQEIIAYDGNKYYRDEFHRIDPAILRAVKSYAIADPLDALRDVAIDDPVYVADKSMDYMKYDLIYMVGNRMNYELENLEEYLSLADRCLREDGVFMFDILLDNHSSKRNDLFYESTINTDDGPKDVVLPSIDEAHRVLVNAILDSPVCETMERLISSENFSDPVGLLCEFRKK